MANRFWVGGSGNISDTAHWASTSGGAGGVAKPTSVDDVIFDNNSGSNYIVTFDETGNVWLSLTAGDSTKKAPQTTKNVTLKWGSGIVLRSIGGNVTIYGDVGYSFSDAEGLNIFLIRATATFKSFTDSRLPTLDVATGSAITVTMDSGVADSARTYYVMQQLVVAPAAGSNAKIIFPTQAQGAIVQMDDFTISVGAGRTANVDMNSGAIITIANSISFSSTGGIVNLLNSTGSTVKLSGGNVTYAPFLSTGKFFIVEVTSGSTANITQAQNIGTLFLDDNSTLYCNSGGFPIITAGLSPGKNVTVKGVTLYANNLPLSVVGWYLSGVAVYKSAGVNSILYVTGGTDGGTNTNVIFTGSTGRKQKSYRYKVYSGAPNRFNSQYGEPAFLGEYTDVINDPDFSNPINSFGDQLVIRRAVDPTNFGEASSSDPGKVGYKYRVDVICYSDYAPSGEVIYQGFISSWMPNIQSGQQYVDITLLPYSSELAQFVSTDSTVNNADIPISAAFSVGPTQLSFTSRKIAQAFTTPAGSQAVTAIAPVGFFSKYTNLVRVSIQTDSGDAPSGSEVWGHTIDTIPLRVANQEQVWIPAVVTLSGSTKYWFVYEATDDAFGSGTPGTMSDSIIYTTGGTLASHAAYWNGSTWIKDSNWCVHSLALYTGQGVTNYNYGTLTTVSWKQAILNLLGDYVTKGGNMLYTTASIADPGININYNFNTIPIKDAITNLMAFTPVGWYFYIDLATSTFYVKAPPTTPTHLFNVGKNIQAIQLQKTMETIINTIYMTGGDTGGGVTLWREYVEPNSMARYGQRAITYNDNQLTDVTTANFVGAKLIGQFKDPTYRASIDVSGTLGNGYHIEAIRPGDMFSVLNVNNDILNLIVSQVDYHPATARLVATTAPPAISNTVIDIKAGLQQVYVTGNPNRPTIVEE